MAFLCSVSGLTGPDRAKHYQTPPSPIGRFMEEEQVLWTVEWS